MGTLTDTRGLIVLGTSGLVGGVVGNRMKCKSTPTCTAVGALAGAAIGSVGLLIYDKYVSQKSMGMLNVNRLSMAGKSAGSQPISYAGSQ